MRPALEIRGTPASPGLFAGPLVRIGPAAVARRPARAAEVERAALDGAIGAAIAGISALLDTISGEAGDMLAFQVAMLEDAALTAPAFAAIAKGIAADAAWSAALDGEIAGYEAADDDYFRARSADLKDIRDRVLRHLAGTNATAQVKGAILSGQDIAPTLFLETDWSSGGGLALWEGSPSSHVAMLARARGVPMVVSLGRVAFNGHERAIVDGDAGLLVLSPDAPMLAAHADRVAAAMARADREAAHMAGPAATADGTRIEVMVNVAGMDELDRIDPASCDGIGLMRTEFLFRDGAPLPDEEAQYLAYRRLLEWAGGKPVTIRTLDIGGDKPIAGLTPEGEANPFLGLRGIRLMLRRPDVFGVQLRALARASVHGNLKVMLPMVTVPGELDQAVALFREAAAQVGIGRLPSLGIMVEVPAAALAPELFAEAAFFSIGSNDLTQYVTAASRDSAAVAALNDPAHPAVLKLIAAVAEFGRARAIPVSLCGDMASEPKHLAALLKAGLRSLSVAPAALGRVKAAIAGLTL